MRCPSPHLRAAIERQIAEDAKADWPRSDFAGRKLLFLSGNGAFLWCLDLNGNVFWVDPDTYRMEAVLETNQSAINDAIGARAQSFPELLELLQK